MVSLHPLVWQVRSFSDTLCLIERLMLPTDYPRRGCKAISTYSAYSFAAPSRIVLWHHVGDLWPLGCFTKKSSQQVPGLEFGS